MMSQSKNLLKIFQNTKFCEALSTSIPYGSSTPESHWKDYLFPPIYTPPAPPKDAGRVKPEFTPEVTEKECECIIQSPTQDDLNNLPRRHIFRDTAQIPDIMEQVYSHLKSPFLSLSSRPIFLHCMSDTGVMCYQGLQNTVDKHGDELDIRGVVWDSCPGPRPEMTAPRVAALIVVNMFCCLRDGLSYGGSLVNTYKLFMDRAVPGYLARRRGHQFSMNLIDGVWCGYFARDLPNPRPELFLYSKADFYLPWTYLEENVLATRKARDVRTMRWDKSSHVDHLRKYKQEYTNVLLDFIHTKYETSAMEDQKEVVRREDVRIAKQERKKRQQMKNRDEEVNNRIRTSSFS